MKSLREPLKDINFHDHLFTNTFPTAHSYLNIQHSSHTHRRTEHIAHCRDGAQYETGCGGGFEPRAPPLPSFLTNSQSRSQQSVKSVLDLIATLSSQRKAPTWPGPGTPAWPPGPPGPWQGGAPKPETKPPGLKPTPRPVPSWFHPPMALPPPPKEEVKEPSTWGPGAKEELEEGVTPPMMSPLAAGGAAGGADGGGGQGLQGLDPRHLLHLLTRKVGNYSPSPPSSPTSTTILIKLSLLHNFVFSEFLKISQPALLAKNTNNADNVQNDNEFSFFI